eukprot:2321170-Prymnesium_polylepis.1
MCGVPVSVAGPAAERCRRMRRKPGIELGDCPVTARLYGIIVHHTHTHLVLDRDHHTGGKGGFAMWCGEMLSANGMVCMDGFPATNHPPGRRDAHSRTG